MVYICDSNSSIRFPSTVSFLSVFCHPSADDEKKDMILQKRIRGFSWVTYEQLEVNVDFDNPSIFGLWEKAQKGLAKFTLFLTWFTKFNTDAMCFLNLVCFLGPPPCSRLLWIRVFLYVRSSVCNALFSESAH